MLDDGQNVDSCGGAERDNISKQANGLAKGNILVSQYTHLINLMKKSPSPWK